MTMRLYLAYPVVFVFISSGQALLISNLVISLLSTVAYGIFTGCLFYWLVHSRSLHLYAYLTVMVLIFLVERTRVGILSAIIHLQRKQTHPETST